MIQVLATDEFRDWYLDLSAPEADSVTISVERLEQLGVALGHPHSSEIKGTSYAMRELRIAAGHSPLRVFYAFDPRRDAVLLLGGSKAGNKRFYRDFVSRAAAIWERYLKETSEVSS